MTWEQGQLRGESLKGLRVLVVDDEPLIAMDLERILTDEGASVAGPCGHLDEAQACIREECLSAAVLDVRLGGEMITPVAEMLAEANVPFVLYSGQVATDPRLSGWPNSAFLSKPAPGRLVVETLRRLVDGGRPGGASPGGGFRPHA